MTFFRLLLEVNIATDVSKNQQTALKNQYQILRLWGDDFGVLHGELDKRLEGSRAIKSLTLSLLTALARSLISGLPRLVSDDFSGTRRCLFGPENFQGLRACSSDLDAVLCEVERFKQDEFSSDNDESDGDNSDAEDSEEELEVGELLDDLRTIAQSLLDLSPSIERPAKDPDYTRLEARPVDTLEIPERSPHQYYSDLIREKHPCADPELIEVLGRANWERYKLLQSKREQNEQETEGVVPIDYTCGASSFYDSGLGSSVPSGMAATSYAQSMTSKASSYADGNRPRIPPLPEGAKDGKPFPCDACGRRIIIKTNRQWRYVLSMLVSGSCTALTSYRKHLYQDLQPYRCFYGGCVQLDPFPDRQRWTAHLIAYHGLGDQTDMKCVLCLENLEPGKYARSSHLVRHLEDISLSALPCGVESDADSGTDSGSNISATSFGEFTTKLATDISGLHPDRIRALLTASILPETPSGSRNAPSPEASLYPIVRPSIGRRSKDQ
jgi:hypothetical protein